jgi:hypothetical protein
MESSSLRLPLVAREPLVGGHQGEVLAIIKILAWRIRSRCRKPALDNRSVGIQILSVVRLSCILGVPRRAYVAMTSSGMGRGLVK